jgi:hypothetical protein
VEQTSASVGPAAKPGLRDFAETMHARFVAKNGHVAAQRQALVIPAVLLVVGAGVGGAARALLSPCGRRR